MNITYDEYRERVRRKLIGILMAIMNESTKTFEEKLPKKSYQILYDEFLREEGDEKKLIDKTLMVLLQVIGEKLEIISESLEDKRD